MESREVVPKTCDKALEVALRKFTELRGSIKYGRGNRSPRIGSPSQQNIFIDDHL
jgi:hypothetical protein